MRLFYCFYFERNYDVSKVKKNVHAFVEKNINFNKNDTQSKMENLTEFRRDEPCVLAHIRIANQK